MLEGVVGVSLAVLLEPGVAPLLGQPGQMLDADSGPHPTLARESVGIGTKCSRWSGSAGRAEGEEAIDPEPGAVVLLEVLPHAEDLEAVGQPRQRLRLDEGAQRRGVVGGDALVGVERDDPLRFQLRRGLEQAVAVRRVVPAGIVGPWGFSSTSLTSGLASRICRVPSVLPSSRATTASAKRATDSRYPGRSASPLRTGSRQTSLRPDIAHVPLRRWWALSMSVSMMAVA